MSDDALKLIGASEDELRDPRVKAALAAIEDPASDQAAARAICEAVPPPPAPPLAADQLGLARYGLKLRRKTNIHDLFIQRVIAFGVAPTPLDVAEFQTNAATQNLPVPVKVIPATYLPSVFIFILAAPFESIETALRTGEAHGFYAFAELIDGWIADTGIPTDKTVEVFNSIQQSLAFLEKLSPVADPDTDRPGAGAAGPTLKKRAARGSSRITR